MNKEEQNRPDYHQDKIGDAETSTKKDMLLKNMTQRKKRTPLIVTLCSIFIYILFFSLIYQYYGQAMAVSATIPVIVIGWFYGLIPGICAGILSYPLNILMYLVFGADGLQGMITGGGGITGTFSLILIGAIIGRVRDLSSQLKKHRDRLDELVKIKTVELKFEIDEKESAFKKLAEAKTNLDDIIDNSLDCIMLSDKIGYVEKVNKYFLELLGYTEEEVAGKFVAEFSPVNIGQTYDSVTGELLTIDEAYLNRSQEMITRLLEKGKVTNWEAHYLLRDGRVIPIEQNIVCLYNQEGERTGAVAIIRDITERKISESKLKKTKEDLDNLIESSLDGIVVSDKEGNVERVNKAFLELVGFKKDEIVGKHIMELSVMSEGTYESTTGELVEINEAFFNTSMEMTAKLYEEGKVDHWESYYRCKDGKIVPVEMNIAHLYNEKGDNTGAVGICRDITERKKTEREIKEAKKYLDNAIENSLDAIIITDNNGYLTQANRSFVNLISCKEEEVIGKHIGEFTILEEGIYESTTGESVNIDSKYFDDITTFLEKLIEEGGLPNHESYKIRSDKKVVPIESNTSLLYNEKNEQIGAIGVIRDITARKKAEKEIKEARDFLESVIENSWDAILITDSWGNIISVNTAMQKMCGFNKEELIGEHTSSLFSGDEELNEFIMEKTEEMYEKGYAFYNSMMKTKDDQMIEVECGCSLIREDKENITAAVAIIRDVTERRNMENKLYQSEKLKSLGELAGGVAHDFNNVLAAILGRVQLLKRQFTRPEGIQEKRKAMIDLMKSLEIIERASFDGAETVRRIQEFARKKSDDKGFTQVNINELLDNALEFTGVRWKDDAEAKGIKVNIQKEFSPLPPTAGSASELREVFTNLINNALDAMPQGGNITIKTTIENNQITIKIEDTGVGIPENVRKKIFDPFFTTKGVQSTGLGMSISYGIINRHKGTILVDSSEGKGTAFIINIPLSEKTTKEEGVLEQSDKEHKKAKILVIEDEEDVRQLLYDILISEGHEVEVASDGNQGLRLFKSREFDMVFTDLGMPEMSGWQVAETVKSINRRIPVAVITGWNVELQESEMRARGVNLIAHKPFQVNQILQLVKEGMELRKRFEAA